VLLVFLIAGISKKKISGIASGSNFDAEFNSK
jgi:hypothetical protein